MTSVEENSRFLAKLQALIWTGESADQRGADQLSLAFFSWGDKNDEDPSSRMDRLFHVIIWLIDQGLLPGLIESSFASDFYNQYHTAPGYNLLLSQLEAAQGEWSGLQAALDDKPAEVQKRTPLTALVGKMREPHDLSAENPGGKRQPLNKTPYRLSISTFRANIAFFLEYCALTELILMLKEDSQAMTALLIDIQLKNASMQEVVVESPPNSTLTWIGVLEAVLTQPFYERTVNWLCSFADSCDSTTLDRYPFGLCVLPGKGDKAAQVRALQGKNLDELLTGALAHLSEISTLRQLRMRLLNGVYAMFSELSEQDQGKELISANLLARCRGAIVSALFTFYAEGGTVETVAQLKADTSLVEDLKKFQLLDTFSSKLNEYGKQIFNQGNEGEAGWALFYRHWLDQEFIREVSLAIFPDLRALSTCTYPWTEYKLVELSAHELIRSVERTSTEGSASALYSERIQEYVLVNCPGAAQMPGLFDWVLWTAFTLSTNRDFQEALLTQLDQSIQPTVSWYRTGMICPSYGGDGSQLTYQSVLDRLVGMPGNHSALLLLISHYKFSPDQTDDLLMNAVRAGRSEIVMMLMSLPTQCQPGVNGVTYALYGAVQDGKLEIVKVLTSEGGDKLTEKMVGQALCSAVRSGELEIVKVLTSEAANKLTAEGVGQALCSAVVSGKLEIVKVLMTSEAANKLTAESVNGALCSAVRSGKLEIVKVLMRSEAANKLTAESVNDALCSAVIRGELEIVKIFMTLEGGNKPTEEGVGKVLGLAAQSRKWKVVVCLLTPSLLMSQTNQGFIAGVDVALEAALNHQQWDLVNFLIDLPGRNQLSATMLRKALCCSARNGQANIVQRLVSKLRMLGALSARVVNDAFQAAAHALHTNVMQILMCLPPPNQPDVEILKRALRLAAKDCHSVIVQHIVFHLVNLLKTPLGSPSRPNRLDAETASEVLFGLALPDRLWDTIYYCLLAAGSTLKPPQLAKIIQAAIERPKSDLTEEVHTPGLFKPRLERHPAVSLCIKAAICLGAGLRYEEITIICSANPDSPIQILPASAKTATTVRNFLSECELSFTAERTANGNTRLMLLDSSARDNTVCNIM